MQGFTPHVLAYPDHQPRANGTDSDHGIPGHVEWPEVSCHGSYFAAEIFTLTFSLILLSEEEFFST